MARLRPVVVATLLAAVTLGALACATDEPALDPDNLPGTGTVVEVEAVDNVFEPEVIEVRAGTEVVWTNTGRNVHDVTPATGKDVRVDTDWGAPEAVFGQDAVYRHVFTEPGEYRYYCTLHGTATKGMFGKVVVTR
jgi:plastocyanin